VGRPSLAVREPYDRVRVTRAAIRLFKERGYDGTSMLDIANSLGIHKSSLYHHISGKEQILDEAVRGALGSLLGMLDEPEAVIGSPLQRLQYVVRRTVQIMVDRLDEVTVLLRVRGNTPTERWALERRREFDRRVERLVELAIREGEIRAEADAALVTRLLFGMSNSVTEWYQPGRGLSADAIADGIMAMCFDGLSIRRRSPG
jgi:AcrR family transcriptional regulator